MISFENDYSEGAHEEILRRLAEVNKEGITGYGNDEYCESAKEKIRQACKCPDADIYFLVGGTQTNQTVIDSVLQSYEGVIAAETGHVASHEAGAIEASGHKVLTLPQQEGKIQPKDVADCLNQFYSDGNHEHMVFPGMVYISHPTEYGTLYTRGELAELSDICQQYHIPLYLDGARLGYGLAVEETDVTMEDIAGGGIVVDVGGQVPVIQQFQPPGLVGHHAVGIGLPQRAFGAVDFYMALVQQIFPRRFPGQLCAEFKALNHTVPDGIQRHFEHWFLSAQDGAGRILSAP